MSDVSLSSEINFSERLISLVRHQPILYRKQHGGYKNTAAKGRIWSEIAEQLASTEETCERRWRSLREKYSRKLKKLHAPSESGAQNDSSQQWKFWENMSFLREHIQPRNTKPKKRTPNPDAIICSDQTKFSDQLICLVKDEPILYRKQHGGDKNTAEKGRIWSEIAEQLDSTEKVCERSERSLRDKYSPDLKKLHAPSESSAQNDSEQHLEFGEGLSFLREHIQPRNTKTNIRTLSPEASISSEINFSQRLICLVKDQPILYKKQNGGYKNIAEKGRIWSEIAKQLASTEAICERRWRSLREKYCRKLKRLHAASESTAQNDSAQQWEFWEDMSFLREHIQPRNTKTNIRIPSPSSSLQDSLHSLEYVTIDEEVHDSSSDGYMGENRKRKMISHNHLTEKMCTVMDSFTDCLKRKSSDPEATQHVLKDEEVHDSSSHGFMGESRKRKMISHNHLKEKLCTVMDTFTDCLKRKSSDPGATKDSFGQTVSAIIGMLRPDKRIRAKADILAYLADVQRSELDELSQE